MAIAKAIVESGIAKKVDTMVGIAAATPDADRTDLDFLAAVKAVAETVLAAADITSPIRAELMPRIADAINAVPAAAHGLMRALEMAEAADSLAEQATVDVRQAG